MQQGLRKEQKEGMVANILPLLSSKPQAEIYLTLNALSRKETTPEGSEGRSEIAGIRGSYERNQQGPY